MDLEYLVTATENIKESQNDDTFVKRACSQLERASAGNLTVMDFSAD